MRRRERTARGPLTLVACALAMLGAACASPGMPPGGPKDDTAPKILSVRPDSGALNVRTNSVIVELDEVVSERPGTPRATRGASGATAPAPAVPTGGGTAGEGLGAIVIISPSRGRDRVEWHRDRIEIVPRGGFRPNTTYRITLLPGLADLRGNAIAGAREIVFSTGNVIPTGAIGGVVFDWVAGRGAANAPVEVFLPTDTTFRWSARADSLGRFTVRDLAPGSYRLRAWVDGDNDGAIDGLEPFDAVTIDVDTTVRHDLYAFVHDTIGPRIEQVEARDSLSLRVRFDRAAALAWVPDSTSFTLRAADSSRVALGAVLSAVVADSIDAVARARDDSVRAAADTTPRPAVPLPARPAPRDTLGARRPALARAIPQREWVIRLGAPLAPGAYRLSTAGVIGLSGARRDSEREFRVRPPQADSAATRRPTPPRTP